MSNLINFEEVNKYSKDEIDKMLKEWEQQYENLLRDMHGVEFVLRKDIDIVQGLLDFVKSLREVNSKKEE